MEILSFIIEMIGTVAFAISGALVAIDKKMDILGVAILGLTTAVGGGVIRDLILDKTPPTAFTEPLYAAVAIVVSLVIFIPKIRNYIKENELTFDKFLLVMDSLGLGIFTVVGLSVAKQTSDNAYLIIFVAVLTGVGGGIMRDVMSNNTPFIFIKHFYACTSIIGAVVTYLIWDLVGQTVAMTVGTVVIFILRVLAAKYRWSLPKA